MCDSPRSKSPTSSLKPSISVSPSLDLPQGKAAPLCSSLVWQKCWHPQDAGVCELSLCTISYLSRVYCVLPPARHWVSTGNAHWIANVTCAPQACWTLQEHPGVGDGYTFSPLMVSGCLFSYNQHLLMTTRPQSTVQPF